MNGYDLSRKWFDYSFANPEVIKPNHTAVYFFAIEHCNRLGWKEKFGFPTTMVMEALGIKSYNTYIKILNDIINIGFIKIIERSKNQYSANIIALSNFNKPTNKALDKALVKHGTKQSESTVQSTDSIIKQLNKEQLNNKQVSALKKLIDKFDKENKIPTYEEFKTHALEKKPKIDLQALKNKYESWVENGWKDGNHKKILNWRSKLSNTVTYIPELNNHKKTHLNHDTDY